jgi:hypothetical protein
MLSAAMAHLAEGLCLSALLTPKEENYICPVGKRIPTVSMM